MSRAGKCIDNGPTEGFWSNLKTEMYYLHTFDDYESLVQAVEKYIHFYNYRRRQKKLDNLPPMKYAQRKAGTFI
ncbi:MAG: IS3 family transposase [Peptococcaceae bacterium]|nr:IS3 family transposase [Peptococcaceae bacterium]